MHQIGISKGLPLNQGFWHDDSHREEISQFPRFVTAWPSDLHTPFVKRAPRGIVTDLLSMYHAIQHRTMESVGIFE